MFTKYSNVVTFYACFHKSRAFAQMKIKIPWKTVFGGSEQLIENVLFDAKLPKLTHYLAKGTHRGRSWRFI